MNYQEALEFIEKSHKFGMKLGLENTFKLLELLGNPQDKLKFIHVAGTNGKGSVCSFISSILKEEGYKVGLYTSPYLETFTERIRLNGNNIPEKDVARIITIMKEKIDKMVSEGYSYPTEFEIETVMAFYYYYEQEVDYVVLEVGLGGRYDATNVIKSLVSVITSISLDHTGILGDTLGKIAYEKAGIIKEDSITVVYKQSKEAEEVIKSVCKEKNTRYIEADFENLVIKKSDINSQIFDCIIIDEKFENMEISLIGDHQINNAVLALTVIKVLKDEKNIKISDNSIKKGLTNTKWAGRIEKIGDNPIFIIDGAHNEDGAKSLARALENHFNGKKMTLLIGMLKDKDIDSVLQILINKFEKVITTTPDSDRAINSEELKEMIEKYIDNVISIPKIEDAVKYILENAEKDEIIISAGSLYMIGHVRQLVK